ncbi:MAG TPA: AAA family ATPase [Candidatus Saccharimonadales bacterium]
MNSNTFIHPSNKDALEALTRRLSHAVLLTGPPGLGLEEIARIITTSHDPHPLVINPEANSISIELIRELYANLRTKQGRRVILIIRADRMTLEAQNAFLKLLEEPGEHISFILTSEHPGALLPTIRSRVQSIQLTKTTKAQSVAQLDAHQVTTPIERAQIMFIAQGLPGKLKQLATDKEYFSEQVAVVRSVRTFLEGSTYDKLLIIQKISSERETALMFLQALELMLKHSLQHAPSVLTARRLDTALVAEEKLLANGHVRTQLMRVAFD